MKPVATLRPLAFTLDERRSHEFPEECLTCCLDGVPLTADLRRGKTERPAGRLLHIRDEQG